MIIVLILIGFCVACILLAIFLSRKYVRDTFNAIDTVLDRILARDVPSPAAQTGERRISKLTHKAARIMDMCRLEAARGQEEKETIQSLIADMSHQMKTPLAGISMYTDILLEGRASPEEQQEFLSRMKNSTEKLQWIMDGLIKMSRLEAGAIQLKPAPAGIAQTIAGAVQSVAAVAAQKNICISAANFDDILLLHDKKWTREAIVNILENAIKYSATEIKIDLQQLPVYAKITISDNGAGIPKSDWNQIFKRFYRGQNAKDSEGAGLGLYLVSLIMEKQSGYVMVDSAPGRGTAFSLFLRQG